MSKRELSAFTVLYFCNACGAEVYRHEHVRRRTQRLLAQIQQQRRLALVGHMERVGHREADLSGALWINEESGDDGFEVKATGEKCPMERQASTVLKQLMGGM
jgi:hypothetical protein